MVAPVYTQRWLPSAVAEYSRPEVNVP